MDINQRIEIADENLINSEFLPNPTVIKVVGVGNGGCNAVNRMIEEGLEGVSFIAMNTDAQQLARSKADVKVVLGREITGGLGAGTDPEKGAEAARRDEKKIASMLEGANLVFVASGFGGGTGTGASPIVAGIAKASGALTIGVVTKPFEMEGQLRMSRAEKGIEQMSNGVDSLIVIPNENLNDMFEDDITFEDSLKVVDDILRQAVQGISDIIIETGFGMNVDFADVQTMIRNSDGRAHLGIGYGKGERRIDKAVTNAFNNPLLDVENIRNASGILANIVCPKDFSLREHKDAMKIISHYASENANIKVGVCQKEEMLDEMRVTIIATGFEHGKIVGNETTNTDDDDDSTSKDIPTSNQPSDTIKDKNTDNMVTRSLNNTKQILDKIKVVEQTATVENVEEKSEEKTEKKESVGAQSSVAAETVARSSSSSSSDNHNTPHSNNINSSNNSIVDEMDIDVDFDDVAKEPKAEAPKIDKDIEEAVNIANLIKNSPSKSQESSSNNQATVPPQSQAPVTSQTQPTTTQTEIREQPASANNTHELKPNSDHVVEQENTHRAAYNTYNTYNYYNSEIPSKNISADVGQSPIHTTPNTEPVLLDEKKDSSYTNESLESIAPSYKHEDTENSNYSVEASPTEEIAKHKDFFEQDEPEVYDDADIEKPAFLRRVIQTKK